jgi:hypothetical protein
MLISENLAIIVFLTIIITAVIISWYFHTFEAFNEHRLHTFIMVFGGLGVIITFLFYYNVLVLQSQQQASNQADIVARLNTSIFNNLLDAMNEAAIVAPQFILSLTPLTNPTCCGITNIPKECNPVACTKTMTLSYRIFSLWQDYIHIHDLIVIDEQSYICNFLQRANSSLLYEQWLVSKLNFDSDTQTFGDLLFTYGLPITLQVPKSYEDAAQMLLQDPIYKNLFV